MRWITLVGAVGSMLLASGCDRWTRHDDRQVESRIWSPSNKPEDLVRYLNVNAQRIRSLESPNIELDLNQDGQKIGVSGMLACQKNPLGTPPNFRLDVESVGKREVVIGSNAEELWYWAARAPQPFVYHCTHTDFRTGRARMPFPLFQPELFVEALGIAECDPNRRYEVRDSGRTLELIERTTSAKGETLFKVIVFNKAPARDRNPQVIARELRDASGKRLLSAQFLEMQRDGATGAEVARVVKLSSPPDKVEIKLTINRIQVNGAFDPTRTASLFSRQNLNNIQGYDLARGPDIATGSIRPAGALQE